MGLLDVVKLDKGAVGVVGESDLDSSLLRVEVGRSLRGRS